MRTIIEVHRRTVLLRSSTATWTPQGFRIDVPATQILDRSSGHRLRGIAETWAPLRGDGWSRVRSRIQLCRAEGVPVPPTAALWDRFAAGRRTRPRATGSVLMHRLPLAGDAPAVAWSTAGGSDAPAPLALNDLRGTWSVPPDTTVFVCENPGVIHEAAARLGPRSRPLVRLSGFPGAAAEYLLLGIGFCGARLKVHTDHDLGGRRIYESLFARTIDFEEWCPGPPIAPQQVQEEACLPHMLDDLRI